VKVSDRIAVCSLRVALVVLMSVLPTVVSAQNVAVTTPGIVSVTSALLPIYNGQYVLQTTDFGFLWLDTVALKGGLVEAESSCAPGMPPSNSGIYVVGDCNGTGTISSSGNYVLVRQFNSQCGAAEKGYCGGPSIRGPARLTFGLGGSWPYLGNLGDLADSTQTTDPQGRTWWVESLDLWHFVWHASGAPNAPPTSGATATNLSAAGRTDKENYYGDKWQLADASISGSPITSIAWDFLYKGSFAPDESGGPTAEGTVTGYFPCDPSGVSPGTFRTGANCLQSLGLTNPPAIGSYAFAEQSANANGTSVNPFVSSAIAVVCPQATIVGYTGFAGTCAKTGGTLGVLVGGNADATGSSGNVGEAVFDWSFTGSSPISVQGPTVPVPSGATGFTLTITYPGGYTATAQGAVTQANLVAAFSLAPNPALVASALTLTNQMQVASATLNSVDFSIQPGACGTPPVMGSNPLASSFLAAGGTATVTGPATSGGYCMYLRYNFTPSGGATQSQVVSSGFATMDWTAAPQISISPVPFCSSSCQIQAGTTYELWDSETITVSPHPGAAWDLSGTPIGASSDANAQISWTPASACSACTLRVVVNGVAATLPVSVSGPSPTPTPTPTPVPTPSPTPVTATGYHTISSCRVIDTRNPAGPSGGPALSAGTTRSFPVAGSCGIPSSAKAVAANLAIVLPTDIGDLRLYPSSASAPMASTVNFKSGVVRANNAVVSLGSNGQITVQCDMLSGATDFFLDVYGYFE
jgi:hypothetical protein